MDTDIELELENLRLYAEENDMSFDKLKKNFLKTHNKKIKIAKKTKDVKNNEKKTTKKTRNIHRKKKHVNMENNNIEDTNIYHVVYEQMIINDIECFVPTFNCKLVDNEYVYDNKSIRIGKIIGDSILFFK